LKKRSKKLLHVGAALVRLARAQVSKSFLVLFFKKEHSSSVRRAQCQIAVTSMFSFKPDASPEARERNVAAIRQMGHLPMVRHYLVQPSAAADPGPTQMQWQVIGDFASVADYHAYSQAPVHLAIRDDFKAHTSRVAFLDVKLA